MIIIGIDVGSKGGLAIYDTELADFVACETIEFKRKLDAYKQLKKAFDLYKPNACIVGRPNRFYNVVFSQSRMIGVVELVCEMNDILCVFETDTKARKDVFGGVKKHYVHKFFEGETPDVSDAMLFCKYMAKSQQRIE